MELKYSYLNNYLVVYWAIKTHTSQCIRKTNLRFWLSKFLSKQSVPREYVWGQRQTELNSGHTQNSSYPTQRLYTKIFRDVWNKWELDDKVFFKPCRKATADRARAWICYRHICMDEQAMAPLFSLVISLPSSWQSLSPHAVLQADGTIQFLHAWTLWVQITSNPEVNWLC